VDEVIVPDRHLVFEAGDEIEIGLRDRRLGQFHDPLNLGASIVGRIDRIGQQRFAPAKAQERAHHAGLAQGGEEHLLMIAHQDPHPAALLPVTGEAQHARAVWPAIDQVTQENHRGLRPAALRIVGVYPRD
jgi:hypothetical protein